MMYTFFSLRKKKRNSRTKHRRLVARSKLVLGHSDLWTLVPVYLSTEGVPRVLMFKSEYC